ncbi:hypothetical protein RE735_05340 [Bacillus aerius]|uniref:hypothetical protein n=1 Tax=Bacillus aerius TaxID=293388 RepID=UPI002815D6D3|nr:hypothetical protein [Bacillus aerius]WMT29985.1 hypothetical protein RE735_05340 [Bacillus aerius]
MKYLNESEQQELLEEEAENYLRNLLNSNPVGREEAPSVYLSQGKLQGMCRIFNATFKVELRRRITFYKYKNKYFDEKFWFQVENEYITEEEAECMIVRMNRENRELSKMRENI